MAVLIDTSVLGRLANAADQLCPTACTAIARLHRRGERLHITAQNLIEFRNFATRPVSGNGLGLPPAMAAALGAVFEANFPLLYELPTVYLAWRALADA